MYDRGPKVFFFLIFPEVFPCLLSAAKSSVYFRRYHKSCLFSFYLFSFGCYLPQVAPHVVFCERTLEYLLDLDGPECISIQPSKKSSVCSSRL